MNYKNILGLGLIAISSAFSFSASAAIAFQKDGIKPFNTSKVANTTPTIPNDRLKPIRKAQGTIQVFKTTIELDPATNIPTYNRVSVCTKKVEIEVYDGRGANLPVVQDTFSASCNDSIDGEPVTISLSGIILYNTQTILDQPPQDLKNFMTFSQAWYPNNPKKEIPAIPTQMSFTKDLNQSYFGSISSPNQYTSCEGPAPSPQDPTQKPNCSIVNPVAYQTIWEVEDKP